MFDIKTTKCQQRKKILDLTFSKEETLYFGQGMRLQQHFLYIFFIIGLDCLTLLLE